MSEEKTKDIAEKYDTAPTIETLLTEMHSFRQSVERRFDQLDVRLDRIESEVKTTHAELFTLRADFKEFRAHFKEPA
jgi:uncharacterized protein (DUF111 family)